MIFTLLLNSTYECISFISERRCFKLLARDKVEVLSIWKDEIIRYSSGEFYHPAVIKLNRHTKWFQRYAKFNRIAVFKRDLYCCQYCGKALSGNQITIDHIVPRSKGGGYNWLNCISACYNCNNFKNNRTPKEAKMELINIPFVPLINIANDYNLIEKKHQDWKIYLGIS